MSSMIQPAESVHAPVVILRFKENTRQIRLLVELLRFVGPNSLKQKGQHVLPSLDEEVVIIVRRKIMRNRERPDTQTPW